MQKEGKPLCLLLTVTALAKRIIILRGKAGKEKGFDKRLMTKDQKTFPICVLRASVVKTITGQVLSFNIGREINILLLKQRQ